MDSKTHDIWNIHFIEQIIDTMADGVFTLDNNGRVTSWNRSMERISGFSAEEAIGNSCQILNCSRCFGRQCPSGIRSCKILKDGKSEAQECILVHKAGHTVPIIKNARVVRNEPFHQGYILVKNESLRLPRPSGKERGEAHSGNSPYRSLPDTK